MRAQHDVKASAVRRGPDWRRLVAAVPPLVTAAAFATAWRQWGTPYATVMAKTIQLEFVVIHAGVFLGVCILLRIETALFRVLRWVAVLLLSLMYLRIGYSLLGWQGVLMIIAIFIGTYSGFLMASPTAATGGTARGRRTTEIGVRWGVSLLAFGLISRAFDLPQLANEWTELRASVGLGVFYFATLAVVESTPLYSRLRGETREVQSRPEKQDRK